MTAARLHDILDMVLAVNIQCDDISAGIDVTPRDYSVYVMERIWMPDGKMTVYDTGDSYAGRVHDPELVKAMQHLNNILEGRKKDDS